MKMKFNISSIAFMAITLLIVSCKGDKTANYPSLNLLEHGFSISVKAPEGAEVKKDDFGLMQELTIQNGEDYNVQILKSQATTSNINTIKTDQLNLVKSDRYFSKIVEEYDFGFIFEKKIDERVNYDFRYVKLLGENEYTYQTGMLGTYTEEEVRAMYNSVQ